MNHGLAQNLWASFREMFRPFSGAYLEVDNPMISVGAVVGGPECGFFDSRLRRFMTYCREHRADGSQSGEVNIVYHLPGSIARPDYTGLRTGRFSRKEKTVMIQIAVEKEWIESLDEKTVFNYIFQTADESIGLAKSAFDKGGVPYELELDRKLLDSWKDYEGIVG